MSILIVPIIQATALAINREVIIKLFYKKELRE
jgi:hypothetical protein